MGGHGAHTELGGVSFVFVIYSWVFAAIVFSLVGLSASVFLVRLILGMG